MTGMLWWRPKTTRVSYPIGREMRRRRVDVTYAARPRFTGPPLSALWHACKSIQTITHRERRAFPRLRRPRLLPLVWLVQVHSSRPLTGRGHLTLSTGRCRVAAAAGNDSHTDVWHLNPTNRNAPPTRPQAAYYAPIWAFSRPWLRFGLCYGLCVCVCMCK